MGIFGNAPSGRPAGIGSKNAVSANNAFSDLRKQLAWATTRPLTGLMAWAHPNDARLSEEGHVICYSHYGKCDSEYGWEIDHRHPSALGGSDNWLNLRARQWRVNRSHGGFLSNALRQGLG